MLRSLDNFLKILSLYILTSFGCNAQVNKPIDFIPDGYSEFEKYFGDLNKDGLEDCVVIIKKNDAANIARDEFDNKVDRNRRGILVLFKKENGYELADKNFDCFSSENEDGAIYFPPELWIKIKNGKLNVHYGFGRYGYWEYTFLFRNSNFELIEYNQSENRGPYIEQHINVNFLTKKKLIRENTYQPKNEEDIKEVFKDKLNDINVVELLKHSEIKDFDKLDI